jgi:hypothetical protein
MSHGNQALLAHLVAGLVLLTPAVGMSSQLRPDDRPAPAASPDETFARIASMDKVRIRPADSPIRYVLLNPEIRGDTLAGTIDSDTGRARTMAMSLGEIAEIDRRGRAWKNGLLVGAVLGGISLATGAVALAASNLMGQEGEDDPASLVGVGLVGGAIGAFIGGTAGALIGSAFTHWTPLERPEGFHGPTPSGGRAILFSADPSASRYRVAWAVSLGVTGSH